MINRDRGDMNSLEHGWIILLEFSKEGADPHRNSPQMSTMFKRIAFH